MKRIKCFPVGEDEGGRVLEHIIEPIVVHLTANKQTNTTVGIVGVCKTNEWKENVWKERKLYFLPQFFGQGEILRN